MYEKDGMKYFIVDGHIHRWDASPENQANACGEGFIQCFYDYHRALSPREARAAAGRHRGDDTSVRGDGGRS